MSHHWIVPIDEHGEPILAPQHNTLVALAGRLQHKAQASIVAFALHTIQTTSVTFEADVASFANTDALERLIRSGSQGLSHGRIQMVRQPTHPCRFGKRMQRIFGKAILLPERGKGGVARLFLEAWQSTSGLKGGISPHGAQASQPLRKHRIIELPRGFQMSMHAFGWP
jgi:hypothetical protein